MSKTRLPLARWGGLFAILLATPAHPAGRVVEVGTKAEKPLVPSWNARGLGPLPWQGIACLDVSDDGRFVAVGTISPPGDPNLFVLDESGKLAEQRRAGLRWLNEATVSNDGRFFAALCTTPEGTAGDSPRLYAFREGNLPSRDRQGAATRPLANARGSVELSTRLRLRDFRPGGFLFHYGDHSNHLPRVACRAGDLWAVAGDDAIHWLSPAEDTHEAASLGRGVTTTFAASPSGRAVVGRFVGPGEEAAKVPDLLVVERGKAKPLWGRVGGASGEPGGAEHSSILKNVGMSPRPERGVYGPPAPPYQDVRFEVPLAVAIDEEGEQVAVADYEGWQRVFRPRDGSAEMPSVPRFMPSRPAIRIYSAEGRPIRRTGPTGPTGAGGAEDSREGFWGDLAFSPNGKKLLIWPHNWTCRGLGGQPFLPADTGARELYILDIASGALDVARFPDAISSAAWASSARIVAGCWDHRVYLIDTNLQPLPTLAKGLDVGAAGLVRASKDGKRIAVATTAGTVLMLDPEGKELWRNDLNQTAKPGEKPWTKKQQPGKLGPGLWRTNGGMAHSDMGAQILIEAPEGLILIDPNAGASFEQNWARIQGAGLDPLKLKYVLLTHEHGDHAPGAYLWRVATGAQVVASAEMAYILQHHLPHETGYGFHPPNPVDIALTEEKELDLAGLKVKAIRLSGHTYGSMGYVFAKEGKTYVATGDLIMPGGVLGYSGSFDFSAQEVLNSLRKLAALKPDEVLGGHGGGPPDNFVAAGIEAGEATGWSRMPPEKPKPLYRFAQTNYLVAAWLQPIQCAAYGDIDGDGRPDVAVLVPKANGSVVRIYLNKGGKLAEKPDAEIDLPDLTRGWKLRTAHLNGDKVADFFVSSEGQAMVLLSQEGQLKFKAVPLHVIRGSQVFTGDFNGDGRTDLLIGSRFVGGCSIACQREDGTFQVRQTKAPARTYLDVQLADVNGDKRDDLIASSGEILLRQPDGSFEETASLRLKPPSGEPPGWAFLAAADFDKDGWTDVALLANSKEGTMVSLYRNARNPQEPFPKEPSAAFVVPGADVIRDGPTVADWNSDGIPDLILSTREKPSARILLSSQADGLNPQRTVSIPLDYTPHYDTRLGVADFDGDGRPDLAGFGPSAVGAVGVYVWLQP